MGEIKDIFNFNEGDLSVPNGTSHVEKVSYTFPGSADFPDTGTFTLLGRMMESDSTSDDDLIGDYDQYVIQARDMFEKDWTYKFTDSKNTASVSFILQFVKN